MRLSIFSLLISLLVRILANYILVITESPQTKYFDVVQSKMVYLRVWFVLIIKSHLRETRLWWASHGLSNRFGDNIRLKYPITMVTMEYLQRMDTVSIVMKKVKLRVFQRVFPSIKMRKQNFKSRP